MADYEKLTGQMALQLAAPHTWVASIGPALFAILFCRMEGYFLQVWQEIFLLVSCIFLQSSVNTFNDYIDFIKGTDGIEDCLEEKDAVLLHHHLSPRQVISLGICYLFFGVILGVLASLPAGYLPLGIGCIGLFAILCYSGGPFPISYLPLGEIVSGFVMGALIPLGIVACSDGGLQFQVILYALPFVIGIAFIMLTNNSCDIEKDKLAKRCTLAVLLGRKRSKKIYQGLLVLWGISIVFLSARSLEFFSCISIFFLVLARHKIGYLWKSSLLAQDRIEQMKNIVLANIIINGGYLLAMASYILVELILA